MTLTIILLAAVSVIKNCHEQTRSLQITIMSSTLPHTSGRLTDQAQSLTSTYNLSLLSVFDSCSELTMVYNYTTILLTAFLPFGGMIIITTCT